MTLSSPPVDVVIPVHNSQALTRRCIESIYARIGHGIGDVHVHDNASCIPTAKMLDELRLPRLHVVHATENTGFGDAVNHGVARTKTPFLLVLNSDVEARDDFLSPLVEAMLKDDRLAAVTPGGNTYRRYDLSRYTRRSGCVVTHNLSAYAFLLRRRAFVEVGGFDVRFGLGFYEDLDLSRRLLAKDWWIGIRPDTDLHHEVHGSFRNLPRFREILEENRVRYLDRHSGAYRQILLVTGACSHEALPGDLRRELEAVFLGGGEAHWISRGGDTPLPALEMRRSGAGAVAALRLYRRRQRKRRPLSELWITNDASRRVTAVLTRLALRAGLSVRRFPARG
jgi:GT2 family glycosyltransferase